MRSSRLWPALVLLLLLAPPASAQASEPTAAPAPPAPSGEIAALFLPLTTPVEAAKFCPNYFCPIYYPDDCSCEWITCPNGQVYCGVWNGGAASSAASAPSMPRF